MKLSNFSDYSRTGENCLTWEYEATVHVTTGILWWEKINKRLIRRSFTGCWFFVGDGEYVPNGEAEKMERAYKAQNDIDLAY